MMKYIKILFSFTYECDYLPWVEIKKNMFPNKGQLYPAIISSELFLKILSICLVYKIVI